MTLPKTDKTWGFSLFLPLLDDPVWGDSWCCMRHPLLVSLRHPELRSLYTWASGLVLWGTLGGCSTPSLTTHLPPARGENLARHAPPIAPEVPRTNRSLASQSAAYQSTLGRPSSQPPQTNAAATTKTAQVVPVSAQEESVSAGRSTIASASGKSPDRRSFARRLQLPPELPGAESPPAVLPPADDPQARAKAIENLFPPFGPLPTLSPTIPETGLRYTLAELEARTLAIAPAVDQAANAVVAADGLAWQAGRPFNPQVGYEADTVRTLGTAGYQGVYVEQVFQTAGKRQLAQQVACYDITSAEFNLRKARVDQLNGVRKAWYQVLVARENLRITRALAEFSDSIFELPLDQLRQEQIAPYEPLPIRALAIQARAAYEAAQARDRAAWQVLAAAVGDPSLPPGDLEGTAVMPVVSLDYAQLSSLLQGNHTDLQVALNRNQQSQVEVERQYRKRVPDLRVYTAIQEDYTSPPVQRTTWNLQVGVPVPIFDLNRGNIQKARAEQARASREFERVRNELQADLADAWQRYETARIQVEAYRNRILPDQARAYIGIVRRHDEEGSVTYTDVVVAQQNLVMALNTYITSLTEQWNAWGDLLRIVQIDDPALLQYESNPGPTPFEGAAIPPAPAADRN